MSAPRRGSDAVAEALRQEPSALDEVGRARMEQALLAEARDRGQRISQTMPVRRMSPRRAAAMGLAVGALAAAAVFALLGRGGSGAPLVRYETFAAGHTVESGRIETGQAVNSAAHEKVLVHFGKSKVRLEPRTKVRFERLARDEVHIRLQRGAVDVEFNPKHRGEEHMAVETRVARVEVVGTAFRVEVDGTGTTTVSVVHGTVRVVPKAGGVPRYVSGGEHTVVRASPLAGESTASAGGERVGSAWPRGASRPPAVPDVAPLAGASRAARASTAARLSQPGSTPGRTVAEQLAAGGATEDQGTAAAGGATEDQATATSSAAGASSAAPRPRPVERDHPLAPDPRFDLAQVLLSRGRVASAIHELLAVARTSPTRSDRALAWSQIADIRKRQNQPELQADALRRAAEAGAGTVQGLNAIYDLATVREREFHDLDEARAGYQRYLAEAPNGPLAEEAQRALCRLGDPAYCPQ